MMLDDATQSCGAAEWIAEGIAILYADQTELQYVDEACCPSISDISGGDFADNYGYDYAGI